MPGLAEKTKSARGDAAPFIRMSNVGKSYIKDGTEFIAVSDVSFDIASGELVSLVGPSGCGKTTVLKILAGLHQHSHGEVCVGGADNPFVPGRDVGMVFQQALLLKWRTILDNVLLPAEILGLPRAESAERARDLLAMVGLQGFEACFPYELSGGMQQRAAIARAGAQSEAPLDGRAVRRSRCTDARQDESGAVEHLAQERQDDHLRHA
jgi:NitT/TauT family transport system ATP-binding protein